MLIAKEVVTVTNPSGLHARPAAELSRLAQSCASRVTLRLPEGRSLDVKSILALMSAGIRAGTRITVECEGDSARDDLSLLVGAIGSGLGE